MVSMIGVKMFLSTLNCSPVSLIELVAVANFSTLLVSATMPTSAFDKPSFIVTKLGFIFWIDSLSLSNSLVSSVVHCDCFPFVSAFTTLLATTCPAITVSCAGVCVCKALLFLVEGVELNSLLNHLVVAVASLSWFSNAFNSSRLFFKAIVASLVLSLSIPSAFSNSLTACFVLLYSFLVASNALANSDNSLLAEAKVRLAGLLNMFW